MFDGALMSQRKSDVKINGLSINAVCWILSARHCPEKVHPHSSPRIFWIFPFEKARTMVLPYPSMDSRRKIHTNQKANSKRHKEGEIKKNNYFSLVGRQVKFKAESKSLRRS